jgi:predicted GIY-YIG superfamily endonuclease
MRGARGSKKELHHYSALDKIAISRLKPFFSTIEQWIGSLHLSEIEKIIRKELNGKSGIYGFLCKTTGKLYIGSSINLSDRLYRHIKGTRSNVKLQNAINKYNLHDFIFIVFEYCEPEDLISREQLYIDSLGPEYNILKTAGSLLGFKHSAESIAKMGRLGESNPFFGKTHSPKTTTLMSVAKGTAIYAYDLQGSLVYSFSSANKAAKYFNCCHKTILRNTTKKVIFQDKWILSTSFIIKE